MAGIARSIRLLVGVAMVAGGATLAAPMVTAIVSFAMAQWGGHGAAPQPAVPPTTGPMPAVSTPMAQPPAQSPAPPPTLTVGMADPPPAAPPVVADAGTPPPALDRDYRPPSPPTPLPGLPAEFLVPGPQVGNAYRSTLEVPPPPLLDSQQPPPLAVMAQPLTGGIGADGKRPVLFDQVYGERQVSNPDRLPPSTYLLTGMCMRTTMQRMLTGLDGSNVGRSTVGPSTAPAAPAK